MHVMNDCDFFFLAGAQIIRKENCFFLPSEKITVTCQCFDHFVNKVRDHLVIKRFRQIAMEQPIRVMRCESNVRMKSKAWALSLVPHFSLSQPRLTFLDYPWEKMRDYSLSTVILFLNVSFLFLNFCLFVLRFEILRFSLFE